MTAPQATDPAAFLDRLEETHGAATKGPWLSGAADGAVAVKRSTAEYGSHEGDTFALLLPGPEVWNPTEALANARLCAEARTAVPALIAAVRAVLAKCDALEAAAPIGRFFAEEFRGVVTAALGATGGAR